MKKSKQHSPSHLKERLDDLLFNSCVGVSRPTSSVDYYYDPPTFAQFNVATYFETK